MKETLPPTLVTFLRFWGIAIAVLFLPYLGLYILGLKPIELLPFLAGTVVLGVVFALLLTLDKQTVTAPEHVEQFTLWALFHELVVRRKSLLTLFILASIGIVIGTYYICVSLFSVEYAGDSGVIIRLPGHTVYYIPISPYGDSDEVGGWENTRIPLEKGETFTLEISGSVSPGFLQGLDLLQQHIRAVDAWERQGKEGPKPDHPKPPRWHFTGPEGYPPQWYPEGGGNKAHPEITSDFKSDEGLTVKGKPHNSVIGIVLPPNDKPKRAKSEERPVAGYDWEKEKDELLYLSAKTYPCSLTANKDGVLWVTINDADDFRWDNVGFFFLKLTRRPTLFKGHHSAGSAACQNP